MQFESGQVRRQGSHRDAPVLRLSGTFLYFHENSVKVFVKEVLAVVLKC